MKQTKGKKIRNIALSCVALALVAAISVAITLASVTANLGSETNTITSADNITLAIQEDEWDGKDYDGATVATTATIGETLAKSYSTSMEIPKNPQLKNTSTSESEWVALKLTYKVSVDGGSNYYYFKTYDAFAAAIATVEYEGTTGFNTGTGTTNWTANSSRTVFYYNSKLTAGSETSELFDTVVINSSFATDGDGNYTFTVYSSESATTSTTITSTTLPQFVIELTGYAVQGDNIDDLSAAQTALNSLIG